MADREPLLNELRTMPEEAYSWFVTAAATMGRLWPSGDGGFRQDSRQSIERAHHAADEYMKAQQEEQP